jgi:hypothetical protein
MNTQRAKVALHLAKRAYSAQDTANIAGRTALEAGAGGYGAAATVALLAGLLARKTGKMPDPKLLWALGGLGAGVGGTHGFQSAKRNADKLSWLP